MFTPLGHTNVKELMRIILYVCIICTYSTMELRRTMELRKTDLLMRPTHLKQSEAAWKYSVKDDWVVKRY
jgi:hypothetical protein